MMPEEHTNYLQFGLQYRCTGRSNYNQTEERGYAKMVSVCGFLPHQQIQCDVRSVNSAGIGGVTTSAMIRTNCAGMFVILAFYQLCYL